MPTSSQVFLSELVRLAFPAGTTLPADLRERQVKWVIVAGPGIAPRSGDLVLCSTPPLPEDVDRWNADGAAGLAVLSAAGLAQDPAAPFIRLPEQASLRDIQQAALKLLLDRQLYLIEHGARIYQRLARLSVEEAGLTGVAGEMLALTGRTVVIQDKRLKLLAQAIAPEISGAWLQLLEALSSMDYLPETLRDRQQAAMEGGWRDGILPGGLARLVCPIVAKGMARGYLSIIGRVGELDALDQLVVEHGAAACALEMAKAKAVSEVEKRAYGDFLDAVLTGRLPQDELRRWAQRIGYDVEPPHAALVWRWSETEGAPSVRRLETLVNQSVAQQELNALVNLRPTEVIVFCAIPGGGRPQAALLLADLVLKAAVAEYPRCAAYAGAGRPMAELTDWKDSYREATQAAVMAGRLYERQPLFFGDLSVYRLLFQLEGHPELEAFCSEVLGPLQAFDGAGELLETLEAFCDQLGNLSHTSEKLSMHRNTLLYRIERISQLLGADLNQADMRLAVHLALKARKLLRPSSRREAEAEKAPGNAGH